MLIPFVVRFDHACSGCGASFSVFSDLNIAFVAIACVGVTGAGALVVLHPPRAAVGAERSNQAFGIGGLVVAAGGWALLVSRVRARLRHPRRR